MSEWHKIQIAVLVGDNGEFAVSKFEGDKTDWGFMADCIGVYDSKTRETTYPTAEHKYIVDAMVYLPQIETIAASDVAIIPPQAEGK